jgi:DNA-binding CsgD family transcriptional regulator
VVVSRWTQRQAQILELAALGQSDKQIAASLGLSTHTVRTHLQRLYRTQSLSNRAEAVAAWLGQRPADGDSAELQEKEVVLVKAAADAAAAGLPVQSLAAPVQGELVNKHREESGLQPLAWHDELAELAQTSAGRMATQGYLDTIMGKTDPHATLAIQAENTGYWSGINDHQMHAMFVADPKQRANILGPHSCIGAGCSLTENGVAFLSVLFAK